MSVTRPTQIVASLVCSMVLVWTPVAKAECVPLRTADSLKNADIVFLGTVTHVVTDGAKQVVTLDVSRVWKGEVRRSIALYQAPWVAFDSVFFPADSKDTQLLVFAKRMTADQRRDFALSEHEAAFTIPPCGGTWEGLRDALRRLGRGRSPR